MNKYIALAALLLSGAASPALAQASTQAVAPATCTGPAFTWQRLGGDPFAANDAEAMRKLPEVLDRMVAMGCLPQNVADNFAEQIRANPEGAPLTVVPGSHLAYMESGKHPILNVTVGTNVVSAGTGLVVAITARHWRALDQSTGITYLLGKPFVCQNWFLAITLPEAAPPPTRTEEPDCVVSNRIPQGSTDGFVHIVGFRVNRSHRCTAWRYAGETEWRPIEDCDTDCVYNEGFRARARELVGNADMTFATKIPVSGDRPIQVRLERAALDQSSGIALADCLEKLNGEMSDSVYTRHDDYLHYAQWNQDIATVFRTQASIPDTYEGRSLWFRFSKRY